MALAEKIWTPDEVRLRLNEAAQTLRRLPFPRHGAPPRDYRTHWPEVVRTFWEVHNIALQSGEEIKTKVTPIDRGEIRIRPSPAAIARMDEAIPWLYYILDPRHRRVVFARSLGLGCTRLAKQTGMHRNTIATWYDSGLSTIAQSLTR